MKNPNMDDLLAGQATLKDTLITDASTQMHEFSYVMKPPADKLLYIERVLVGLDIRSKAV